MILRPPSYLGGCQLKAHVCFVISDTFRGPIGGPGRPMIKIIISVMLDFKLIRNVHVNVFQIFWCKKRELVGLRG